MSNTKNKFHHITFEDFKSMALDSKLSKYEKVGFPDKYRAGKEEIIFNDILGKVPELKKNKEQLVVDIGCGCSELPKLISRFCEKQKNQLVFVDSIEMLNMAPNGVHIKKIAGEFPKNQDALARYKERANLILVYSVIQYPFAKGEAFEFINACLQLLTVGGKLFLGDIPNRDLRKRFFESPKGIAFHQNFTGNKDLPIIDPIESHEMTDEFTAEVLSRYRKQGYNVYILPQADELPFGSRREDIIIEKM